MACTPLNLSSGQFINEPPPRWEDDPSTSKGNKTVTLTDAGISVTGPTGTMPFHNTVGGRASRYMFFGPGDFLLLLDFETGAGPSTRSVSLVDFTTTPPSEKPILTVLASSSSITLPVVQFSAENGAAFLIFTSTGQVGAEIAGLAVYRSDNGELLCAGPTPYSPSLQLAAEVSGSRILIKHGGDVLSDCPLPAGKLQVIGNPQTFPDVIVGGCAGGPSTREFTLRNNGTDCLTISAIDNAPPFTVSATSRSLPASLAQAESMVVTVTFAPNSTGVFGPTNLGITRTPANGDSSLVCRGTARGPVAGIDYNPGSVNFGSVPVGSTSAPRSLQIRNTGERPIDVSVAGPPPGSAFQWSGFTGTLTCGAQQPIAITFSPTTEGPDSRTLTVVSDTPGSPDPITIAGVGCVANAEVMVPPAPFPSFGQVQRGFRTVRFITIRNSGDGPLTFSAHIAGADAALYGLQPPSGSVTDVLPTRNYTVDPVSACGPLAVGTGETFVAVAFFANDAPRLTQAELIIDSHNATNGVPSSWTYQLGAEIIAGVAVDAALVLDRSGSMADPLGTRTKSDAAIAAGRLFAQLLRPDVGDRVTVVGFNETPDTVQPIVELTSGGTPDQAAVVNAINGGSLAPTGSTAIAAGMFAGFDQLATPRPTPPAALTRAMVVLTDGMDNTYYVNPADGRKYTVLGNKAWDPVGFGLEDTLPIPLPSGIKVYGVGLGAGADVDVNALNQIASGSGGYFGVVGDLSGPGFFNLEKYFTQIFMDVAATPTITDPVYTILPGQRQLIEFDVLRGDVNALVVVYDRAGRLPFHLLSPIGETIDVSSVPPGFQLRTGATATARFIEFVMPIAEPTRYAGRWAVVVEHRGRICFGKPPEGRDAQPGFLPWECRRTKEPVDYGIAIGVGSNFRMQPYVTAGVVRVGEPILLTAVVTEAGLEVTGCNVVVQALSPSGAKWSITLLDDGAHADGEVDDGEYARRFTQTAEEGSYQFTFRAEGRSRDGEPVVREAMRAKYVEGRVRPDPSHPEGDGKDRPGTDKCCDELIELMKRQTELLEQLLRERS